MQKKSSINRIMKYFVYMSFFALATSFLLPSYQPSLQALPSAMPALRLEDPLPTGLFIKLASLINPTVVNISTSLIHNPLNPVMNLSDPIFNSLRPYLMNPPVDTPIVQSLGTGFIIRDNGLILTNAHVINRGNKIQVQFMNSKKLFTAKVIGKDMPTDVALLKVDIKQKLPVAQLGNSSELMVGEWVAAFGNPYGHQHTVTKGIISAINREIDELNLLPFLQTDASINPGNSGGPLVNTRGQVIGINTAVHAHGQGISFAIPIDNVKLVLKDLHKYGRVRRGFIGVQMANTGNKKQPGALIVNVLPNTPAQKAGIKRNDIVVMFNGKKITNFKDLFKATASTPLNQTIPVKLLRQNKRITLNITVKERQSLEARQLEQNTIRKKKRESVSSGLVLKKGAPSVLRYMGLPPLRKLHPIVIEVKRNSPAEFSGFRKYDILLKVNGVSVRVPTDVQKRIRTEGKNVFEILRYRFDSRQYVSMIFHISSKSR